MNKLNKVKKIRELIKARIQELEKIEGRKLEVKLEELRREIAKEIKEMIDGKKDKEINLLENILDVKLPKSYQNFLLEKDKKVVLGRGYKIHGRTRYKGYNITLGLVSDKSWLSILETTEFLRIKRPDLPLLFIVISFSGNQVICLDLTNGNELDAPVVEVSLEETEKTPILINNSFKKFIEKGVPFNKIKIIR